MTTHPARATYAAALALDSDSAEVEHSLLLTFADAFRVAPARQRAIRMGRRGRGS